MKNIKKHAALTIALIMAFTVIPAFAMADDAAAATALKKPVLTNHAAGKTSIKNTWKKVKGAKGYEVYRATKAKGKYKKIKTIKSGKTVSWTNKKLTKNKKYYYKVRAYKIVKGKKKYSKFSAVQWAKPTNSPNPVISMSGTAKTTSKISVKITNKGRYNMVVNPDEIGFFIKNLNALEAFGNIDPNDPNYIGSLTAAGVYPAGAKKVTIKPGKSASIEYTTFDETEAIVKVPYSSSSFILGDFTFNKTSYIFMASKKYGSEWELSE